MITFSENSSYTFLHVVNNSMRTYFCNDYDYAWSRLLEEVGESDIENWHDMPDYV
jgi:hypothetical protein